MKSLLSEDIKIVKGLDPVADAFSATVYSDIVNTALYGKLAFVVYKGVGTTGTSTITILAGTNNSGTSEEAVPFKYRRVASGDIAGDITDATTAGFTTTAGSSEMYIVEVDPADLPESKPWVRLKAVESVDSPVIGAIVGLLGAPRYGGENLPSAI